MSDIKAKNQLRQRRVPALTPIKKGLSPVSEELQHRKKMVVINRAPLPPGAPLGKRRKRMVSPKREACIFMPEGGPTSPVEGRPSSEPKAGPSSPFDGSIEFVECVLETGADMGINTTPYDDGNRCTTIGLLTRNNDENLEYTTDEFVLTFEDNDDLCFVEEADLPQTKRNASAERACTTDYTDFERQVLDIEDAINDRALRSIAPENAYDFNWSNDEAIFQGRQEIFTGPTPGPTFNITDQTSPLDVFYEMFDVEFIDMICTETNLNAARKIDLLLSQGKLTAQSRLHLWSPTDRDEMITFLAVLILQDLYPLPKEESYFKFNGFATMPFFRQIMTYNRFLLLKTMTHFANSDTTDNNTYLWKIKPVAEYFNKKFSSLYNPSKEIVVDSPSKWHRRLSSHKISTKAEKFGVKTYELCEASSGYLWRFIIYSGKDQQTNYTTDQIKRSKEDASEILVATELMSNNSDIRPSNASALIVYQLVEPLLNRGHTLILDNYNNSPLLARCLKIRKTDVYGTVRLNREFIPDSLRTLTNADLQQSDGLVSYCSDLSVLAFKDVTLVGMISTYHLLRVENSHKNKPNYKPNIILEYNKSMEGLDKKDKCLSPQPKDTKRSRVWYMKLFLRLYNAALFNCFVIFSSKNANISHRHFKTLLAESLLKAHRQLDLTTMRETLPMFKKKSDIKTCTVEDDHFPVRNGSRRTRCQLCAQNKVDSRTVWKCGQCQVNLCLKKCFRAFHKS